MERSDILAAQPQQKHTMYDGSKGHDTAAPGSVAIHCLPTSTHASMHEVIPGTAADNASGPSSSKLPNSHSTGHLSSNSDGSFMHAEGLAPAADADCQGETETIQEFAMPLDWPEPDTSHALVQDADTALDKLSETTSGHAAEASIMRTQEESAEACYLDTITCDCS